VTVLGQFYGRGCGRGCWAQSFARKI